LKLESHLSGQQPLGLLTSGQWSPGALQLLGLQDDIGVQSRRETRVFGALGVVCLDASTRCEAAPLQARDVALCHVRGGDALGTCSQI
jgi:hypothetical protein